jgi:hypothetical protein
MTLDRDTPSSSPDLIPFGANIRVVAIIWRPGSSQSSVCICVHLWFQFFEAETSPSPADVASMPVKVEPQMHADAAVLWTHVGSS